MRQKKLTISTGNKQWTLIQTDMRSAGSKHTVRHIACDVKEMNLIRSKVTGLNVGKDESRTDTAQLSVRN
jgi:hypothetical protein